MSDNDAPSGQTAAKRAAGVLVAVVVLNVLLRVAPLPELDLPSISVPRPPDWLHAVLQIKNWLLLGIIALIVIGIAVEQAGGDDDAGGGGE